MFIEIPKCKPIGKSKIQWHPQRAKILFSLYPWPKGVLVILSDNGEDFFFGFSFQFWLFLLVEKFDKHFYNIVKICDSKNF